MVVGLHVLHLFGAQMQTQNVNSDIPVGASSGLRPLTSDSSATL
jgi:hypothetical protein